MVKLGCFGTYALVHDSAGTACHCTCLAAWLVAGVSDSVAVQPRQKQQHEVLQHCRYMLCMAVGVKISQGSAHSPLLHVARNRRRVHESGFEAVAANRPLIQRHLMSTAKPTNAEASKTGSNKGSSSLLLVTCTCIAGSLPLCKLQLHV